MSNNEGFSVRRSQLFGPYGVGSIMPCPGDQSIVVGGLDATPYLKDGDVVDDSRLARHIGVKRLVEPPVEESVPAFRFPGWVYCPSCGRMEHLRYTDAAKRYCNNPKCKAKRRLIPERFIVVCPDGHMDDFPIVEWVHGGRVDDPSKHRITRRTKGGSVSLGDIVYRCDDCGIERDLLGAGKPGTLEDVAGYTCSGSKPWLAQHHDPKGCSCKSPVRVVQRGGSNVWYADVASAIFIPDGKDPEVQRIVDEKYEWMLSMDEQGLLDAVLPGMSTRTASVDAIKQAYLERKGSDAGDIKTDAEFRWEEYCTLRACAEKQPGIFSGKVIDVDDYSSKLVRNFVSSISLVSTLRETRALVGFTRLLPESNDGLSFRKRRAALSRGELDWTLAMQGTGEGIFIELNSDAIQEWAGRPWVKRRLAILQKNYSHARLSRQREDETLEPKFVLLHSLAHALILALCEECGYSTSSIRERIYSDRIVDPEDRHENMHGILLFTASGDGEGSLGGLVRSGRPGRFEKIFERAIENSRWCSMDPVCIDSHGQGPDSCNLAACYSCMLLPETACERGNKLLDRALLIGTIDHPSVGLFNSPDEKRLVVELEPDFDGCLDSSVMSFSSVCNCALERDLVQEESEFLTQLASLGDAAALETPFCDVTFVSASGDEADASLVWRRSQVMLLSDSAREEFEDAFGEFDEIDSWRVFAMATSDVDEVIDALKGGE